MTFDKPDHTFDSSPDKSADLRNTATAARQLSEGELICGTLPDRFLNWSGSHGLSLCRRPDFIEKSGSP